MLILKAKCINDEILECLGILSASLDITQEIHENSPNLFKKLMVAIVGSNRGKSIQV